MIEIVSSSITDAAVMAFAEHCTDLEFVDITAAQVTLNSFACLMTNCPNLQKINLDQS